MQGLLRSYGREYILYVPYKADDGKWTAAVVLWPLEELSPGTETHIHTLKDHGEQFCPRTLWHAEEPEIKPPILWIVDSPLYLLSHRSPWRLSSCWKWLILIILMHPVLKFFLKKKKQQASEKRIQGWCHICYILTNCNNICIKSFSVSGLSLNRPVSEISWIVVGGVSPCWWRKCCPIRGPVLTRWLASGGQ